MVTEFSTGEECFDFPEQRHVGWRLETYLLMRGSASRGCAENFVPSTNRRPPCRQPGTSNASPLFESGHEKTRDLRSGASVGSIFPAFLFDFVFLVGGFSLVFFAFPMSFFWGFLLFFFSWMPGRRR